jgi:hypothetical protein
VGFRHERLEDNERADLSPERREQLRTELYGAPDEPKYGHFKVEASARYMSILGCKCYYLYDSDGDEDSPAKVMKWKGSTLGKKLPKKKLKRLRDRKAMLAERTTRISRSHFSVRRSGAGRGRTFLKCFFSFRPRSRPT